ncbi:MAG: 6-carboxytetrahydropterin synthase QueD [Selenomonadaceae bacterium]|nr:6-carboxytetrahydropterin synthase QueD [Selenomonadaceae bacterium]
MYELTVRSAFEAAHFINGYEGKCARLHGHNWEVVAVVRGKTLDKLDMLIDFKIIRAELNKVLSEFDHQFLNNLETFAKDNPTAENLARKIFDNLSAAEIFGGAAKLYAIKIYETKNSCVTYTADE